MEVKVNIGRGTDTTKSLQISLQKTWSNRELDALIMIFLIQTIKRKVLRKRALRLHHTNRKTHRTI